MGANPSYIFGNECNDFKTKEKVTMFQQIKTKVYMLSKRATSILVFLLRQSFLTKHVGVLVEYALRPYCLHRQLRLVLLPRNVRLKQAI